MQEIRYNSIGVIHSPFRDIEGVPIQSAGAQGIKGTVEIAQEYAKGIEGIEGFSHVILVYHFHLSKGFSLYVKPFLDSTEHGVFATRAPRRPNPIGISVVRLLRLSGTTLHIEDVDIVDGTPLLDLKPYVPQFDVRQAEKIGWLTERVEDVKQKKADDRFR
jgi:tRNA-Thr(GGU) m(6)t(6)A37 methyltransferase TsaA